MLNMYKRPSKAKSVWRRNKSDAATSFLPIYSQEQQISLSQLKTATKKVGIISRLQSKIIKQNGRHYSIKKEFSKSKGRSCTKGDEKKITIESMRRPATSNIDKKCINSFRMAKKAYETQQNANQRLKSDALPNMASETTSGVKEGLLGQYERYNSLSKHQLIEKLISLQYLANGIFRKNKVLEERVKELEYKLQL